MNKPRKPKKCKATGCGLSFIPSSDFQSWCSIDCAVKIANAKKEAKAKKDQQAERKAHREAKERVKRRSDYMKDAQTAFNAYIRARDVDLPCISCGRHHQGQYHAGHYRSVGSTPELRFEPMNVHKQCAPCNNHKSGNVIEYRISLIKRIGADKVDWLEGPHDAKKYTIDDLKGITKLYRQLERDIKKSQMHLK